jgi:hypothetical protein
LLHRPISLPTLIHLSTETLIPHPSACLDETDFEAALARPRQ